MSNAAVILRNPARPRSHCGRARKRCFCLAFAQSHKWTGRVRNQGALLLNRRPPGPSRGFSSNWRETPGAPDAGGVYPDRVGASGFLVSSALLHPAATFSSRSSVSGYLRTSRTSAAACGFGLACPSSHFSSVLTLIRSFRPGAPGAGVCAWGFSLFHRPAAQFSQSENHFSQARHLRLPVVPRTPVSSTPLFSSPCKIVRTNMPTCEILVL